MLCNLLRYMYKKHKLSGVTTHLITNLLGVQEVVENIRSVLGMVHHDMEMGSLHSWRLRETRDPFISVTIVGLAKCCWIRLGSCP
jgi:hypothetical protein